MNLSVFEQKAGISVSRETMSKLELFVDLFEKWSSRINLVAPSTKDAIWVRHVVDSAQLLRFVPSSKHWLDLGSGGGFPGVVIAILLAESGEGWVNLVESNNKKASFLRMALLETGARGTVHACRIEDVMAKNLPVDVISARALASLDLLLEYTEPLYLKNPNSRALFHKGRDYAAEVDKASDRWRFDLVIHPSAVEADSVILDVTHLARKI